LSAGTASARPVAPGVFCQTYPDAPACAGGAVDCGTCHAGPPAFNPFGRQVADNLAPGAPRPLADEAFRAALAAALHAVERLDADGDGAENAAEIAKGSRPGDATSRPAAGAPGKYDDAYAHGKVLVDFCGRSATRDERAAFAAAPDRKAALHDALGRCLRGEYWRGKGGALWNLANPKIRPLHSLKGGEGAGPIPLADYDDDYALFVYTQIDDHDARDLLLARYYVARRDGEATTYEPFDRSALEDYAVRPDEGACQTIDADERVGMISTAWFRAINTMVTPMPRTTAAQAYRAYLGLDIALLQGLSPVPNEPQDYDNKGVGAAECASCHSTLDPLSYPFSRYEGIDTYEQGFPDLPSHYQPDRLDRFVATDGPRIAEAPERGFLFGQPVENLLEWARVAADSDPFAQALVLDYWQLVFGEPPRPDETTDYANLWSRLKSVHGYGVDRMLHDLVDTEAYGVP
jgi:hypothetical protein